MRSQVRTLYRPLAQILLLTEFTQDANTGFSHHILIFGLVAYPSLRTIRDQHSIAQAQLRTNMAKRAQKRLNAGDISELAAPAAYVDSLRASDYIWKAEFDMDKRECLRLQSKRSFLQGPLIRMKLIFGLE